MDIRKFFTRNVVPSQKKSIANESQDIHQKAKDKVSPSAKSKNKSKKTSQTPSKEKPQSSLNEPPPAKLASSKKVVQDDDSEDEIEEILNRRKAKKNRMVIIDSDSEEEIKLLPAKEKGSSKKRKSKEHSDEEYQPNSKETIEIESDDDDEEFEPEEIKNVKAKKVKSPQKTKTSNGSQAPPSKKLKQALPEKSKPSTEKQSSLQRIGSTSDHKGVKKRPREGKTTITSEDDEGGARTSKYFGGKGFQATADKSMKGIKETKKVEAMPSSKKSTASPKKRVLPPSMMNNQASSPKTENKAKSSPKKASQKKKTAKPEKDKGSDALPLNGNTFVITGVLDSMARDDAVDKIKSLGGKVTSAVSGKTKYLVVGSVLEDGRPVTESKKHKDAVRRGVDIIDETKLSQLLEEAEGKVTAAAPEEEEHTPMPSKAQPGGVPERKTKGEEDSQYDLWADKYRPKQLSDVIGNADILKKLLGWLQDWNGRHLTGTLPKPKFSRENPGARAALLSGPPGIGKTSTAMMVAQHLGYQTFELNASDARSKKSMDNQLVETVTNTALGMGGTVNHKRLVIMDEVDGMAGNFDRGGIAELIKIIKSAKVPIICICNDRQSQKIRSLVNHCFDLRFRRPTPIQISKRMMAIAKMEGVQLEQNAAEMLAGSVGNDIRQVLHALQMWAKTSRTIRYSDMKSQMSRIEKDKILRLSNFDCAKQILSPRSAVSLHDRYNAYFVDYQLIPLLIQQNYLDALKYASQEDQVDRMSQAADSLGDADLVNTVLRKDQNWGLLPSEALCYVRAGMLVNGSIGFPAFPAWLGKFSQHNKRKRLLNELGTHLNSRITGNSSEIRMSYIPHLSREAFYPLIRNGAEGVPATVEFLDEYGLSRDDIFELMPEFVLDEKDDPTKRMDSKTKSAFTRLYNSTSHKSQALVASMTASKSKKKAVQLQEATILDEEEGGLDVVQNEEESDDDVEIFKKKKKGKAAPKGNKKKSSTAGKKGVGKKQK